jgi:hypothetical protein
MNPSYFGAVTDDVFLGDGNGKFQIVTVQGAEILQAADFTRDGKLDLLTTNGIYLQTTASLLPDVIDFIGVGVNTVSPPQTVTLKNISDTTLTITSLTLTGASSFSQTNACGSSLAPGKSCQIQLIFAPTDSENASAVLSVTIPGEPSPTVSVVGYPN